MTVRYTGIHKNGKVPLPVCISVSVAHSTNLLFELLDLGRQLFRLLDIVPFGLPLAVQDLQEVEVLLLHLLLLLQDLAVAGEVKMATGMTESLITVILTVTHALVGHYENF